MISKSARYDCTVEPCPRKKGKYFSTHQLQNLWLTDEDLQQARLCYSGTAVINSGIRVMCDSHWDRFAEWRQTSKDGQKAPRRKEQHCSRCGEPRKGTSHVCPLEGKGKDEKKERSKEKERGGDEKRKDKKEKDRDKPRKRKEAERSSLAASPHPVSKEARRLMQQLKPTLGKRKAEIQKEYTFSEDSASKVLEQITVDEALKRAVRHDASLLTRLFMRVPFNTVGPYAVPPGPYHLNAPAPAPSAPSAAVILAAAHRRRLSRADSLSEPFEPYPVEDDLREMHRRHQQELAEEPVDQ